VSAAATHGARVVGVILTGGGARRAKPAPHGRGVVADPHSRGRARLVDLARSLNAETTQHATGPGVESAPAKLAYAVRAGLAAAVATGIWHALDLTHGIWLAITAVIVIQPRRGDTWAKGVSRIVGTLIGATVGTACAAAMPATAGAVGVAVALTILLCWGSGRLREPMPLAALTTVLVFTFDAQDHALAVGLWRCVEIVGGVAIGVALTLVPFPGE
jgi:uncharacterized membrane protein YccC